MTPAIVVRELDAIGSEPYLLHPGITLNRAIRDFSRYHTLRVCGTSEWPDGPASVLFTHKQGAK